MNANTNRTVKQVANATLDRADLEINWFVEPQEIPFEGNCSAVDEATDRDNEQYIRELLESGNEYAWCTIVVEAKIDDLPFVGRSVLGGCSYASESEFRSDPVYLDMCREAIDDLNMQLTKARKLL